MSLVGEWELFARCILCLYTNTQPGPWRKLWAVPNCRECRMKSNMPGLIRAVPRREMVDCSQGSTKGNWHSPSVSALPEWKKKQQTYTHWAHRGWTEHTWSVRAKQSELISLCFTGHRALLQISYRRIESARRRASCSPAQLESENTYFNSSTSSTER